MDNRTGKMMRNGMIGVFSQIVVLIMSFITRKVFLNYLSVAYLGYNGLFTNILGMLNLAELGVGTALTYRFYRPVAENDSRQVAILLTVYKKIYNTIGIFVIIAGVLISPFVPYLIKDNIAVDKWFVILIFLIQLMGTASTYFFSYRRTIFFVVQRDYICTTTDMIANIIFSVLKIIAIIIFKDYIIYLILQVAQNFASNIYIYRYCKNQYPEFQILKKTNEIKEKIKKVQKEVYISIKNVFLGKFAVFIFCSTDNIIISKFVGITSVGLLANYTLIISTITTFLNKLLDPVQAGFGNLLNTENNLSKNEQLYYDFQFLQCCIGMLAATGVIVLINPLISLCFGGQFILKKEIVVVLGINLYLDILQRPSCNYINALGLFEYDKKISFAGALTNLIISLLFVQFFGIFGVLIATTLSQILFLILRSYYVVRRYLKVSLVKFYQIVGKISCLMVVFAVGFCLISSKINYNYFSFIIMVLVCIIVESVVLFALFKKSNEFKYLIYMANKIMKKVMT